jgi:lysozyme
MELAATVEDAAAREQLPSDVTLAEDEVMGIDVSVHQGQVDWPQVADAGYSFAYIKATEGVDYVDPQFTANWRGVHQAGMTRGAYHYFTLCSSGADQAADFLKTVPVDDTALPPALDLEFDGACDERPEADDAQGEIDAFVSAVEAAWGRRVVVYSSSEWRMHYGLPVAEERPDWLFSDSGRPGQGDWAVWQLRFDGTVPGITKKVDVDVARPEILRETARL